MRCVWRRLAAVLLAVLPLALHAGATVTAAAAGGEHRGPEAVAGAWGRHLRQGGRRLTQVNELVQFTLNLTNLNYTKLSENSTLVNALTEQVKTTAAQEAQNGITAQQVQVVLSNGSVVAEITIDAPEGGAASAVQSTLQASGTLLSNMGTKVDQVPGIDAAKLDAGTAIAATILVAAAVTSGTFAPTPAPTPLIVSGDSGGDKFLGVEFFIGIGLAAAAVIALVVCLIVGYVGIRRKRIMMLLARTETLDQQESDFETSFRQLQNHVQLYQTKYDTDTDEVGDREKLKEHHLDFMRAWEVFQLESRQFMDVKFTPWQVQRRWVASQKGTDQNPDGVTRTQSGVGIRRSPEKPAEASGCWPAYPVTPARVIHTQLKDLSRLHQRLLDMYKDFQSLRNQAFPDGAGPALNIPTSLAVKQPVRIDPVLNEQVELLKPLAHPLLMCVTTKPYGVLGYREGEKGVEPKAQVDAVVVDLAGWQYIGQRNHPKGASGASASIYDWLSITGSDGKFPSEVYGTFSSAMREIEVETRATFHTYGPRQHVIHAISPRVRDVLEGIQDLSHTYLNVLIEFCRAIAPEAGAPSSAPSASSSAATASKAVPWTLRLPPISSGQLLQNRRLEKHMPQITFSALSMAFAMMPVSLHNELRKSSIEVCVFPGSEQQAYKEALERKQALVKEKPKLSKNLGGLEQKLGSFDWVRMKNSAPDRLSRLHAMLLTQQATCSGGYTLANGKTVILSLKDMLDGTKVQKAQATALTLKAYLRKATVKTEIIHDEKSTVMEAAMMFHKAGKKVVAVNAASAYSVGGGVLTGGRHALEESWCTMSTLLQALQKVQWEQVHDVSRSPASNVGGRRMQNGAPPHHIPVDGCIVTPFVEIFRDTSTNGYKFQEKETRIRGVCSVAMFNMNPRVRDSPLDAPKAFAEYCDQVRQKFRAIVAAASEMGAEVLVCPDVGCGVFDNDPHIMGTLFGEVLHEVSGLFSKIVVTGKVQFFAATKEAVLGGKVTLQPTHYFDEYDGPRPWPVTHTTETPYSANQDGCPGGSPTGMSVGTVDNASNQEASVAKPSGACSCCASGGAMQATEPGQQGRSQNKDRPKKPETPTAANPTPPAQTPTKAPR